MKQFLFVGILIGVALRAIAGDITKESLDREFREKLSALYHSEEFSGFARDIVYRMNGDPAHPKIAVDSLGEWFIIDLEWEASGLYLPSRIEWRRDAQIKQ